MGAPKSVGPVSVYRAYDEHGVLLYVGITDNVKRRIHTEHRSRSGWYKSARRVDVRVFTDRETALRVEATACVTEEPTWPQLYDERFYDPSFTEPSPVNQYEIDLTPRRMFD